MRQILLLAVILLVASCSRPAPLAVAPFPHEESPIAADPAVRWGSLPNGARYALMRNNQPAGRASLRLRIGSGSLLETDPQQGLAHMLEHMAFNGSLHYAPGALIPALQRIGIGFGNNLNAHTGFDETVYKIDLPDVKAETLDIGLTVLADQAGGLLLDRGEVEHERGVVLSELRDRDGPGTRLQLREMSVTYAGTRIAERLPIGLAATIAASTPELLRDYYATWYRPERMVLVAVADCDLDDLEARIRRILGAAAPLGPVRAEPSIGTIQPGTAAVALHDAEATATSVRLTGVRERELPADGPATRREQFLRDLGEAVLARRIRRLIETDPACPLQAGGGFSYQWLGLYLTGAAGTAKPGRALDGLRLMAREYRRMAEHGPSAAELDLEAAGVRSGLDAAVAQAAGRRSNGLADAIYNAVADRQVFVNPEQARTLGLELLASATPAAVRDTFRAGWDGRVRTIALVSGRDDLGADGDRLVGEALATALAEPVAAPAESAAITWAYGTTPAYAGALPAVGPDGWAVGTANGISLAVMRTDFQPGQIALRLRLPVRTGPRQAGLAELAARAMADGGLGRHTASDLAAVLTGTTVRFGGIAVEDGALVANASCAPKDLQRCLELMQAWLADAAWRPESEARAKVPWQQALTAEANDVEASTWRAFAKLTLPEDAWRRSATAEEAAATSLAAVRTWLTPLLGGAPLACSIVGDIDAHEAMRLAAGILGGNRPPVAAIADPAAVRASLPVQPQMPTGEHRITVQAAVAKALVLVAWPTTDQYDIGQARRLAMLGGVFNERVREVIREKFGDAYSPSAWHASGDDWAGQGSFTVAISCQPERVDAMRDAAIAIAADLTNGIPAEVLDRVRAPYLRGISERRRQNGWWLGILARSAEQPFRLDWQRNLEADFRAISADELVALAKTWLVPTKALVVIGASRK